MGNRGSVTSNVGNEETKVGKVWVDKDTYSYPRLIMLSSKFHTGSHRWVG